MTKSQTLNEHFEKIVRVLSSCQWSRQLDLRNEKGGKLPKRVRQKGGLFGLFSAFFHNYGPGLGSGGITRWT